MCVYIRMCVCGVCVCVCACACVCVCMCCVNILVLSPDPTPSAREKGLVTIARFLTSGDGTHQQTLRLTVWLIPSSTTFSHFCCSQEHFIMIKVQLATVPEPVSD